MNQNILTAQQSAQQLSPTGSNASVLQQMGINKIWIYKRTHPGDPRADGIFGVENCMGSLRERKFDAVIGIGGKKPWPQYKAMAGQVNWVGVGVARRVKPVGAYLYNKNGNRVNYSEVMCFHHFALYESMNPNGTFTFWGKDIQKNYPGLYRFAYTPAPGKKQAWTQSAPFIFLNNPNLDPQLKADIEKILLDAIAADPNSSHIHTPAAMTSICVNTAKQIRGASCGCQAVAIPPKCKCHP